MNDDVMQPHTTRTRRDGASMTEAAVDKRQIADFAEDIADEIQIYTLKRMI